MTFEESLKGSYVTHPKYGVGAVVSLSFVRRTCVVQGVGGSREVSPQSLSPATREEFEQSLTRMHEKRNLFLHRKRYASF